MTVRLTTLWNELAEELKTDADIVINMHRPLQQYHLFSNCTYLAAALASIAAHFNPIDNVKQRNLIYHNSSSLYNTLIFRDSSDFVHAVNKVEAFEL